MSITVATLIKYAEVELNKGKRTKDTHSVISVCEILMFSEDTQQIGTLDTSSPTGTQVVWSVFTVKTQRFASPDSV